MHCRNCGKELPGNYNKCYVCENPSDQDTLHCSYCGGTLRQKSVVCSKCGATYEETPDIVMPEPKEKTRMTTIFLAILTGVFGGHDFYLGNRKRASYRLIGSLAAILLAAVFFPLLITTIRGLPFDYDFIYTSAADERKIIIYFIISCAGILYLLFSLGWVVKDLIILFTNRKYEDGSGKNLPAINRD